MPQIELGTGIAIFGGAFAMWAWVVAWGVAIMRRELEGVKGQISSFASQQNLHITQTERRLTMLETEFQFIKTHMYIRHQKADEG